MENNKEIKNPKFSIGDTVDNKFHFVLIARNGRTILSSETYVQIGGATNGILSVIEHSKDINNFEIRKSVDYKHYFVLIANNNEIIGTSETYNSDAACKRGIQSVINNCEIISQR